MGTLMDLPGGSSRKQYEAATPRQGPIGRAVRKLTPRKSSLVNLLKGKGWNKIDDSRPGFGFSDQDTTSRITEESNTAAFF
jgi:hypothetical protein